MHVYHSANTWFLPVMLCAGKYHVEKKLLGYLLANARVAVSKMLQKRNYSTTMQIAYYSS